MSWGVVFLHNLQDLFTSVCVWDWIHWFDLSTASRMFSISVQASLCGIIIRTMNASSRTSTLWVTERFITITCVRRITLHSIVHASDLDYRGTLFQLHDGAFLAWFMVWIEWPVTLNAIYFDWVVTPCALVIFSIRVIDWSSLTSNSHDLWLITSAF